MSTINKYNYEAVLLDFAEGRLSAKQTSDLFDFLAAYPDLQEDFDAALAFTTIPDETTLAFSKKDALLKDESLEATQDLIIACVEYIATQDEMTSLQELQSLNPKVREEIRVFSKMKMLADNKIQFSRKDQLIRPVTVKFATWLYRVSYAAAIVLFLFVYGIHNSKNDTFMAKALAHTIQIKKKQLSPIYQEPLVVEIEEKPKSKQITSPALNQSILSQRPLQGFESNIATKEEASTKFDHEIVSMEVIAVNSLNYPTESNLATFENQESTQEVIKEKNARFVGLISEESSLIGNTYGFAGGVTNKVKSFAGEFQRLNEIEFKIFGMRATIHKPSWMNWRRQKVKSE